MKMTIGPAVQEAIREICYVVRTNKNMTPADINKRHGVPLAFSNLFFSKLRDYFRAKEWKSSDFSRIEQELIDLFIFFLEDQEEKINIINGLSFLLRKDSEEVTRKYDEWLQERNLPLLKSQYESIKNIMESTLVPHLNRQAAIIQPVLHTTTMEKEATTALGQFELSFMKVKEELHQFYALQQEFSKLKSEYAELQENYEQLQSQHQELLNSQSNVNIMLIQSGNPQLSATVMEKIKQVIDIPSGSMPYHLQVASTKEE